MLFLRVHFPGPVVLVRLDVVVASGLSRLRVVPGWSRVSDVAPDWPGRFRLRVVPGRSGVSAMVLGLWSGRSRLSVAAFRLSRLTVASGLSKLSRGRWE